MWRAPFFSLFARAVLIYCNHLSKHLLLLRLPKHFKGPAIERHCLTWQSKHIRTSWIVQTPLIAAPRCRRLIPCGKQCKKLASLMQTEPPIPRTSRYACFAYLAELCILSYGCLLEYRRLDGWMQLNQEHDAARKGTAMQQSAYRHHGAARKSTAMPQSWYRHHGATWIGTAMQQSPICAWLPHSWPLPDLCPILYAHVSCPVCAPDSMPMLCPVCAPDSMPMPYAPSVPQTLCPWLMPRLCPRLYAHASCPVCTPDSMPMFMPRLCPRLYAHALCPVCAPDSMPMPHALSVPQTLCPCYAPSVPQTLCPCLMPRLCPRLYAYVSCSICACPMPLMCLMPHLCVTRALYVACMWQDALETAIEGCEALERVYRKGAKAVDDLKEASAFPDWLETRSFAPVSVVAFAFQSIIFGTLCDPRALTWCQWSATSQGRAAGCVLSGVHAAGMILLDGG